jgi:hypothetical protein
MKVGMLWFDSDPTVDIEHRIIQACSFYHEKYGQKPSMCFINPNLVDGSDREISAGIEVRPSPAVQPDYFWVGMKEAGATSEIS